MTLASLLEHIETPMSNFVSYLDVDTIQRVGFLGLSRSSVEKNIQRIERRQSGEWSGYFADRIAKQKEVTFADSDMFDAWDNQKPIISPFLVCLPMIEGSSDYGHMFDRYEFPDELRDQFRELESSENREFYQKQRALMESKTFEIIDQLNMDLDPNKMFNEFFNVLPDGRYRLSAVSSSMPDEEAFVAVFKEGDEINVYALEQNDEGYQLLQIKEFNFVSKKISYAWSQGMLPEECTAYQNIGLEFELGARGVILDQMDDMPDETSVWPIHFGDRNYTNSGYSAPSTGGLQYVQTNHTELVPKINMEGTIAEFKPGGDLIDVKLYGGDNTQLLQWM